jgi:hypothetical protein
LLLGAVWWARVAFSNATMELLANSGQITQSIETARAEGSRLEVQYSVASNPQTIQEAAAGLLGMAPDTQVDYLRIPTEG